MNGTRYRFVFQDPTDRDEIEDALALAVIATEGIHGSSRVRTELECQVEDDACVVVAGTPVGRSLVLILTALLTRRLGEAAFTIERT